MMRSYTIYDGTEVVESGYRDITWDALRYNRNKALSESDWRFMSDQSPSDEWATYRTFLRDLPSNYESANDAADAWNTYDKPEDA